MSQVRSILARLNSLPDNHRRAWRTYLIVVGGFDALLILWVVFAASMGAYFPLRAAIPIAAGLLGTIALIIWLSRNGNWGKMWGKD